MKIPTEIKKNLTSMDYITLQETQKQVREYFVTHQNEFNIAGRLKKASECCPDYYALLSAVVADLSICESWDDVYTQFVSSLHQSDTLYDASNNYMCKDFTLCTYEDDYAPKIKIVCMCSHWCCPENMSIITNYNTGLNALIACDCLEKTGIISSYEFKKKIKRSDAYAKILVKKEIEKKNRSNYMNRWENIVLKYLDKNESSRKCIECGILSILKTEPAWKKKCTNCYYVKPTGVCLLRIPIKI
jgi:hypothetical protein